MDIHLDPAIIALLSATIAGLVSALMSGIIVQTVNRKLSKREMAREAKEDERERSHKEYNMLMLRGLMASLSLGEATADAVESGTYNGKQQKAREYAEDVKHGMQEFMYRQGAEHLN